MTIYFDPPRPHPRAGEKIQLKDNNGWTDAEIVWVYGPNKFFMIKIKDEKYSDGLRFEVVYHDRIRFLS